MKISDARNSWNISSNAWIRKHQQVLYVQNIRSLKMHSKREFLTKGTYSFLLMAKIYSHTIIFDLLRLKLIQDCVGLSLKKFGSLNKLRGLTFTKKLNLLSLLNYCRSKFCLKLSMRLIKGYLGWNRQCILRGHSRVKWSHRLWNSTNVARLLLFLMMSISKASKESRSS